MQEMSFGPEIKPNSVLFRLWAPFQEQVFLKMPETEQRPMQLAEDGWHTLEVAGAGPGTLYQFVLSDGLVVPDPGSRHQPQDVDGPSEVIDPSAFEWQQGAWLGRAWEGIVLYELHIGAFTPEGSFLAAAQRLDHLKDLGVTAIQIMPISDFPGGYGWGYDGVLPYAPESSYGRPEDLMALVDAAHERGICVFLDAVYNHFGPEGNYMPNYAPLLNERHHTAWGGAVNYDAEQSHWVRELIIQNAIYWITQFRIDGLRLDAVHAIKDDSKEHLLHELSRRVKAAAGERQVHLVVENEDNNSDLLKRGAGNVPELFSAQWNDDIHHVLHIAATGETFGYYADYANEPNNLARALTEGFVFQGEHMPYRGETRGKPSADLPPTAFISFIQNHDQIGNRALGDRVIAAQPEEVIKALAAVYLLAPQIPMLFMGEEWNAQEPFPYFCDFSEELKVKVREGRKKELSRLPGFDSENLPDPTTRETFASAKLDWSGANRTPGAAMLDFYRSLLAIRQDKIVPHLANAPGRSGAGSSTNGITAVNWNLGGDVQLRLLANLGASPAEVNQQHVRGREQIFALGGIEGNHLQPWSVIWSVEGL